MGDAEVIRILEKMATQQAELVNRIGTLERVALQMATDILVLAGTENAVLKYALIKDGLDVTRMRKDLEEMWRRWTVVINRARQITTNDAVPPTDAKQ